MTAPDLPLDELRSYRSTAVEPTGLDGFWTSTVMDARAVGAPVSLEPVDTGLTLVDTYDVRFRGWGGQGVAGWLHLPAGTPAADRRLPCVVQYAEYGGGRGLPHEHLLWATAGYAHLAMDNRGQGSAGTSGVTPDHPGSGPASTGTTTGGILDRRSYYYRRLVTDAVRAVDAARSLAQVDPDRVAVSGAGQGGLLAIAAAALADGVRAALVDVPLLCDIPRGMSVATQGPYREIVHYLATNRDATETVMETLGFFDGVHLATRAQAAALFSVGLLDTVCPPWTGYAAYHAWAGEASIREYAYNGHEGGGSHHVGVQVDWLAQQLGVAGS